MRNRRALSSMVGAVFFIIAMTVAIGYISFSMDTLDEFAQTVIVKSSVREGQQNEELEVTKVTINGNLFNITVTNTGQIPMNITRLWVENVTSGVSAGDAVPKSCDIKESLVLQQVGIKIGQSCTNIPAYDTASYQVKLVTERGTIKEFSINSANQQPLYIQLHAIPDTIPTGFTTTILMTVVNNMSSNTLLDLKPSTIGISPSCISDCVKMSGPEPLVYDSLEYGDEATFKWVYRLDGDADDSLTFTGSINNGLAGNDASDVVTIKTVEEAEIAGEALQALGLSNSVLFPVTVLILHDETELTPGGAYQMDSTTPNGVGLDLTVGSGFSAEWITQSTTSDITIDAGLWNASLRYNSPRLPSDMASGADTIWQDGQDGGHTFHFTESQPLYVLDSSEDSSCYNLATQGASGIFGDTLWGPTFGVNGSGGYYFDGTGDYILIDDGGAKKCTKPEANMFSIAGWFKADKQPEYDTKQVILGQYDGDTDFYEISLSDGSESTHGKLYFTWHTKGPDEANLIQCVAAKSEEGYDGYMDEEWHHFAAVRYPDGDNDCTCRLYVDGALKKQVPDAGTCTEDRVDPNKNLGMGRKNIGSFSNYYTGYLDDPMFWRKYMLTADDVTALHQASFGSNAHAITFVLEKTDDDGTTVQTLNSTLSYPLPYVDQMHHTALADIWAGANATLNVPQVTLSESVPNRLSFTMTYVSGMDMNLHIDDTLLDGTTEILSSYIEPSNADKYFPSFLTYELGEVFVYFVGNIGDTGNWYTSPGTRVIFDNPDDEKLSYAALIHFVNGTTAAFLVDATQDSLFVWPGATAELRFWGAQLTPEAVAGSDLVVGEYRTYIFVNGYDSAGKVFSKTLDLGIVSVIP